MDQDDKLIEGRGGEDVNDNKSNALQISKPAVVGYLVLTLGALLTGALDILKPIRQDAVHEGRSDSKLEELDEDLKALHSAVGDLDDSVKELATAIVRTESMRREVDRLSEDVRGLRDSVDGWRTWSMATYERASAAGWDLPPPPRNE